MTDRTEKENTITALVRKGLLVIFNINMYTPIGKRMWHGYCLSFVLLCIGAVLAVILGIPFIVYLFSIPIFILSLIFCVCCILVLFNEEEYEKICDNNGVKK